MVRESVLRTENLVAPLFVLGSSKDKTPIASMPGQFRFGLEPLFKEIEELLKLHIPCVSLFPVIEEKDKSRDAKTSFQQNHFYHKTIFEIKKRFPELVVMSDVAMDPYSSDGHDGIVDPASGEILNDESLEILAKMALMQADAGADIVGPSDMMDGRVGFIRLALDEAGFTQTSIMSYTAKYCSAFYGPFRSALDSAPKFGDKKTYQMDFANRLEAIREAELDEGEGADFLMVKPGLAYLDIIRDLRENSSLPIAAFNVSGEYAMIKAASEKGWIEEDKVVYETLSAFKRAGADIILTYFAKDAARLINQGKFL
jgi:porphobilinogen synthase